MAKSFAIFCLATLIAFSGCTSILNTDVHDAKRMTRLNDKTAHKRSHITLTNGASIWVDSLRIGPDSTSWMLAEGAKHQKAPSSLIKRVEIPRSKFEQDAMAISLVGGGVIGAALGSIGEEGELSEEYIMLGTGMIGVAVGGFIGSAIAGPRKIVYRF